MKKERELMKISSDKSNFVWSMLAIAVPIVFLAIAIFILYAYASDSIELPIEAWEPGNIAAENERLIEGFEADRNSYTVYYNGEEVDPNKVDIRLYEYSFNEEEKTIYLAPKSSGGHYSPLHMWQFFKH